MSEYLDDISLWGVVALVIGVVGYLGWLQYETFLRWRRRRKWRPPPRKPQ